MLLSVIALLAAGAVPSAEAEALGQRLAATGILSTMLPKVTENETSELVAAHPEWTPADIAVLRATGAEISAVQVARLTDKLGAAYARQLTVEELRTLVAYNESPASQHFRRIVPGIIADSMAAMGKVDFKGETLAAFCKKTGKACK